MVENDPGRKQKRHLCSAGLPWLPLHYSSPWSCLVERREVERAAAIVAQHPAGDHCSHKAGEVNELHQIEGGVQADCEGLRQACHSAAGEGNGRGGRALEPRLGCTPGAGLTCSTAKHSHAAPAPACTTLCMPRNPCWLGRQPPTQLRRQVARAASGGLAAAGRWSGWCARGSVHGLAVGHKARPERAGAQEQGNAEGRQVQAAVAACGAAEQCK